MVFSLDLPFYLEFIAVLNLILVIFLVPNGVRILNLETKNGYISATSSILQYLDLGTIVLTWLTSNFLILFSTRSFGVTLLFLINLLISHHFFIYHRHSGINRGMGAPGYFTYLTNFIGFFLSFSIYSNNQTITKIVTNILLIIVGLIFIVSGIYKANSGYSIKKNYGINIGLCNEMWSQFPRFFLKLNINSKLAKLFNFVSVWGEIVGGFLLVTGIFSKVGSIILILMFLGVGLLVRLGILPLQIILSLLLPFVNVEVPKVQNHEFISYLGIAALVVLFIAVLEFVSYLHYFDEIKLLPLRIPFRISKIAHFSSKYFGTILWRVFTPDITALHINVFAVQKSGEHILLSKWNSIGCARYRNVGEAITLASIFTTLRYWPNNPDFFEKRIMHYCRTLNSPECSEYKFTVSHIEIDENKSYLLPVCNYIVNLEKLSVVKNILSEKVNISHKERFSILAPGSSLGIYERKAQPYDRQEKDENF